MAEKALEPQTASPISLLGRLKQFFQDFASSPSSNVVGIDFGRDFVKALKLSHKNGGYQVDQLLILPLPKGIMQKEEIKDERALGNLLKDAFKQVQFSTKNIAFAIPRSIAVIKTIAIDASFTEEDIEARAWIEANRLFPDLVGDIYLDFAVRSSNKKDDKNSELILAACRKDQVKPYLESLKYAGLSAKLVDINSYALGRALQIIVEPLPDEPYALLNINTDLSSFIVVQNDALVHAHDQTFDGHRLLNQTEQYLKDKAIKPDENNQIADDPEYNDILKETLISHLRHTIHFFYSSRPNIGVKKVLISGDCAMVPNLAFFIQREMGLDTQIANPFAKMVIAKGVDQEDLKVNGPALMLCLGLALSALT